MYYFNVLTWVADQSWYLTLTFQSATGVGGVSWRRKWRLITSERSNDCGGGGLKVGGHVSSRRRP